MVLDDVLLARAATLHDLHCISGLLGLHWPTLNAAECCYHAGFVPRRAQAQAQKFKILNYLGSPF